MDKHTLTIEAVAESLPGERTGALFRARWAAYRRWMAKAPRRKAADCVAELRRDMPELMPTFERLLDLFGGGDDVARFLTLYCPPRLVRGCSQAVLQSADGPVMLRAYDHAPHLFDGIVLRSQWQHRATLAVTDCLWGALDGMNNDGLCVALAFSGRNAVGDGFAAPLIVRYLLETCTTTAEAADAFGRLRAYMPYTFVVLDRAGNRTTAFLSPDQPPAFHDGPASTNHRHENDWPEYQQFSGSIDRLHAISDALAAGEQAGELLDRFLSPPIWRTNYAAGSGTLYTAVYRPREGTVALHWPDQVEQFALTGVEERVFTADLPPDPAHSTT